MSDYQAGGLDPSNGHKIHIGTGKVWQFCILYVELLLVAELSMAVYRLDMLTQIMEVCV